VSDAPIVAGSRKIIAKSRFRVEVDGVGNLRCTSASANKLSFQLIETDEGGAETTAEITINTYKFDPITCERPLTDDENLVQWIENCQAGKQDKRNGAMYALDTEGNDFYRWDLKEILPMDFTDFAGDGKAKEESMSEIVVLKYRKRGRRTRVT
jgi:phage tail-like protein